LLTNTDGTILSANPAACEMFQMTEKELKNAVRTDLVIVDEKRMNRLQEERSNNGKSRVELTLKRKDGSFFVGEVTSNVLMILMVSRK
jgi:PAS domain S-box-containing protein